MEPHNLDDTLHSYGLYLFIIDSHTIKDRLQNDIAFGHLEYVSCVLETVEHCLDAALECFPVFLVAIDTIDDG